MNPPSDLLVPIEPLDPDTICTEPLTRECLLRSYNELLEEWGLAANKANNWIDWCFEEEYCGTADSN